MDSWDSDNFEVTTPAKIVNKWEGEDEDEDVKDSWDDPEEEKKEEDPSKITTAAATKKNKKSLEKKIEEKERKRKEELERRQNEKQGEMTPEELLAEKLRRQQLQEESDLLLAKQLLGSFDIPSVGLDSQEDFDKFKDEIVNKLGESTKKDYFPTFVEQLMQAMCVHLSSGDLKKLSAWINNLHIEKLKIEKGEKSKKNKGKGKAKLKLEGETDYNEFSAYTEDYDDFM
ncbi:eukaryotic translation initiation factor 3 subunit J [Homalodisca vitripennis]|uniref:eukaryotic translation initiation factor 3 subunit J n=1 Tax=Homalodisca vitripennis TaxID=197043 RepID=UPI001EEB3B08|nr:eukaryotic translation initiation factor 3 subunit J [Homalodisca vitripennis]